MQCTSPTSCCIANRTWAQGTLTGHLRIAILAHMEDFDGESETPTSDVVQSCPSDDGAVTPDPLISSRVGEPVLPWNSWNVELHRAILLFCFRASAINMQIHVQFRTWDIDCCLINVLSWTEMNNNRGFAAHSFAVGWFTSLGPLQKGPIHLEGLMCSRTSLYP